MTPYTKGQTIAITVDETIYRSADLPAPPPVTAGSVGNDCGSVPIQNPPDLPILADGVFPRTEPGATRPQSIQVTLPADVAEPAWAASRRVELAHPIGDLNAPGRRRARPRGTPVPRFRAPYADFTLSSRRPPAIRPA